MATAFALAVSVAPSTAQTPSPTPTGPTPSAAASSAPAPTPPSASTSPTPIATSAPPVPTGDTKPPLPPAIEPTTALQVEPLSELPSDICNVNPPDGTPIPKQPWHLDRLGMTEAWQIATGKGISIAVIDTGLSYSGSAHTPPNRYSAFNVLPPPKNSDAGPMIECRHGTWVASLIGAQRAGGDTDFSGIAPDAQIIGIRALYGDDAQDVDGVVAAVRAAIDKNVRIINISQAANINRADYAAAIQAALDAGIIVVAAAGNASTMGGAPLAYPAAYPGVISVGMTDAADLAAPDSFAMPGYVSVAAPGSNVMALSPSNQTFGQVYAMQLTGTSYATPLVSGLVALMLEQADAQGVRLSPAEVKARLEATADPPPGPVPDPQLGHGIVNPMRALTITPPPTDVAAAPPSPSYTPRPAPPPADPWPLRLALLVAAAAVGAVALGIGLRIAIPAARARGGGPADPPVR